MPDSRFARMSRCCTCIAEATAGLRDEDMGASVPTTFPLPGGLGSYCPPSSQPQAHTRISHSYRLGLFTNLAPHTRGI